MPGMTKRKFLYNLKRASYEKEWGKDYDQPTAGEKFIAFLTKLLPKIGPLQGPSVQRSNAANGENV